MTSAKSQSFDPEALRARVERYSEPEPNSGCWLWIGSRPSGYGDLYVRTGTGRRKVRAHRLSWIAFRGEIPADRYVLHRCDTPACVNPGHLFLGTLIDNNADMVAKGRYRNGWVSGEEQWKAKLTAEQVEEIRRRARGHETWTAIGRAYGISRTHVRRLVARTAWRHVA